MSFVINPYRFAAGCTDPTDIAGLALVACFDTARCLTRYWRATTHVAVRLGKTTRLNALRRPTFRNGGVSTPATAQSADYAWAAADQFAACGRGTIVMAQDHDINWCVGCCWDHNRRVDLLGYCG